MTPRRLLPPSPLLAAVLLGACNIESKLVRDEADPSFDSGDTHDTAPVDTETAGSDTAVRTPEIDVSPGWITFPYIAVGDSTSAPFTVSNLGDAELAIFDVAWDGSGGPFTLAALDGAALARPLAPGAAFDVVVTYTPTAATAASAVARVSSDDPDEPTVPVEIGAPGCDAGLPWMDDLLVAPAYTDGELALVSGDGAGGFSAVSSPTPSVGEAVDGPVVGDFDEDGGWEVVARGSVSGTLYRWTWDPCTEAWGVDAGPVLTFIPAGAADLDGDGHLDLFGGTPTWSEGQVALGDGAGVFGAASRAFDLSSAYSGYGFTLTYHPADLDGDSTLDLVSAAYDSAGADSTELWWFPGRGDGTFDAAIHGPTVPTAVNGLDLGDLDGDTFPDLVCAGDDDGDAGQTYLLLGSATGLGSTVSELVDLNPGTESGTNNPGASRGRLWDWSGDGLLDLVLAVEDDPYDAASHEVQHLVGDGAGGFTAGGVVMPRGALIRYSLAVPTVP